MSPKTIFPIIGDNFSDLLSKFFHSPKRDFPSPILRRFSSYDLTYRKGSCDVFYCRFPIYVF